jgi:hypothetical protein
MRDRPFGKIIGFYLIVDGEGFDLWDQTIMAADGAFQQTLMAEIIETLFFAVALSTGPNKG